MTRAPPVPDFPARPGPGDFLRGLALPWQALGLIRRTPRLLRLSLLCAAVTLVALLALTWLAWGWSAGLVGWVWARPPAGWAASAWEALRVLVFLVLLVTGASTVPPLLLAPLQDPLSESTEELCGEFQAPPFHPGAFLRGAAVSLAYSLGRIAFLLLGLALLLPLNLVPGVGSLAWSVLASAWTMTWLAAEHLGGAMARHLYPFATVRQVLAERRALCLGFGAAVYVLLWVPVLNTFFLPVAVVGGTLLYRGLRAAGSLPPRAGNVAPL